MDDMEMLMDCPTATEGSVVPVAGLVMTGAAACASVTIMKNWRKMPAIP
jgi:hypothetical protein